MRFKGTQNAVFPDHFYENSNGACGIRNVVFLQFLVTFVKMLVKNIFFYSSGMVL